MAFAGAGAQAIAATPWTPTSDTDAGQFVVTSKGTTVGLSGSSVQTFGADGRVVLTRAMGLAYGVGAAYGADRFVFAGSAFTRANVVDNRSKVRVVFGPAKAGTLRSVTLPVKRESVTSVAGSTRGDLAVVTGSSTAPTHTVWLRKAGSERFVRALTTKVKRIPRASVIALGKRGDALLVWENGGMNGGKHEIFARYRNPKGVWGPRQQLGIGVLAELRATVGPDGRQIVAWRAQDTIAMAVANGARFGKTSIVTRNRALWQEYDALTISGQAVPTSAFVRLRQTDTGQALLTWTDFDDGRYVVRAADIIDGVRGPTQELTPAGEQGVLADAAIASTGTALVLATTIEPSAIENGRPTVRLLGSVRQGPTGSFLPPDPVTADGVDMIDGASAAVSTNGLAFATFRVFPHNGTPAQATGIAVRPVAPAVP